MFLEDLREDRIILISSIIVVILLIIIAILTILLIKDIREEKKLAAAKTDHNEQPKDSKDKKVVNLSEPKNTDSSRKIAERVVQVSFNVDSESPVSISTEADLLKEEEVKEEGTGVEINEEIIAKEVKIIAEHKEETDKEIDKSLEENKEVVESVLEEWNIDTIKEKETINEEKLSESDEEAEVLEKAVIEDSVKEKDIEEILLTVESVENEKNKKQPTASFAYKLNGQSKNFRIDKPTITIGRDPKTCDFLLRYDSRVGRKHAILSYKDHKYYLLDLGSRNGTYINDVKLKGEQELKDGDKVKFADTELIFKIN